MKFTIDLPDEQLAALVAKARAQGLTADELVIQTIEQIAEAPQPPARKEPTLSLRRLLAKYGPAPSAEEIDKNRTEMFANFPRADF
jgi:hypothetical protein